MPLRRRPGLREAPGGRPAHAGPRARAVRREGRARVGQADGLLRHVALQPEREQIGVTLTVICYISDLTEGAAVSG